MIVTFVERSGAATSLLAATLTVTTLPETATVHQVSAATGAAEAMLAASVVTVTDLPVVFAALVKVSDSGVSPMACLSACRS